MNEQWQEHIEQLQRLQGATTPAGQQTGRQRRIVSERDAEEARRGESNATPPGRLGRRLLADVESYLEFFVIAGAG